MINAAEVLNTMEKIPHFHAPDSRMIQVTVAKQGAYNIMKIISEKALSGFQVISLASLSLSGISCPLLDRPSEYAVPIVEIIISFAANPESRATSVRQSNPFTLDVTTASPAPILPAIEFLRAA